MHTSDPIHALKKLQQLLTTTRTITMGKYTISASLLLEAYDELVTSRTYALRRRDITREDPMNVDAAERLCQAAHLEHLEEFTSCKGELQGVVVFLLLLHNFYAAFMLRRPCVCDRVYMASVAVHGLRGWVADLRSKSKRPGSPGWDSCPALLAAFAQRPPCVH
jgi:hypothetical protein